MNIHQLQQKLSELTKDLFYMSESDYPFEIQTWQNVTSDDIKKHIAGLKDYGGVFETLPAHDFFKKIIDNLSNSGEEVLVQIAKRYEKLYDFLKGNSDTVKIWRCGRIEIDIYIVILKANQPTTVLRTTSIET